MDLGAIDLFKGMSARMAWLTQRQTVIARNIANVDTPDYKAKDLKPFEFKQALGQTLSTAATSPMHLAGSSEGVSARPSKERAPYEVTPTGNSVSLEEQMQKAAETGSDYQMITNLYHKSIGLITTALGRGSSS